MQVEGHNGSNVPCAYCKGLEHAIQDCALLKERKHQRGPRQWGQQIQRSQHTPPQVKAARGEALTESSGVLSIGPLRTMTRIAEYNILSN